MGYNSNHKLLFQHADMKLPNVTTLRSGLCYRKSVCRMSVTFVRPTQRVETFGNISSPFCILAIL